MRGAARWAISRKKYQAVGIVKMQSIAMEIYIMRHGEPDVSALTDKKRIAATEFLEYVEIYNSRGILSTSKPEDGAVDQFVKFKAVVTSDLKRSIDSALVLCSRQSLIVDALFREVEEAFFHIPMVRFSPKTWGNIFILLWLIGVLDLKKSFRQAKARARQCTEKLIGLAQIHGKVLFVGHGFINTYIAKELLSLGWIGPKAPSKKYWGYDVYKNDAN